MPANGYIIVGADVEQSTHFLQADGTPSTTPSNTPLDVEFIGRLMVTLSQTGERGVTPAELAKHANAIRHALQVVETDSNATINDADKKAILAKTTVRILFEKRNSDANPDVNERILTIPADGTLEKKATELAASPLVKGFSPPLSYELDEALILARVKPKILTMIARFANANAPDWSPDLQAALHAFMEKEIDKKTTFAVQPGAAGGGRKEAIMSSPLRAFHRAVGIYGTNMCR